MTLRGGLLERDGVTGAVAGLVGAVSAGQAGALFVVGDAGLGKTAVLGYGRDLAGARELRIGFGRGHPMEGALPFGVLVQVLDDAGGHGLLREGRSGSAGGDARAAAHGDVRASRFFGVLRWLERRDGPVLLVIDDLHWADADSLALAVFLCRRLSTLRAGLLASLRPWPESALEAVMGLAQEGCAQVERLAPLTASAAAELLAARVGRPVSTEVSRRAGRLCAGNPLLLEQVAIAIGQGEDVPDADEAGRRAVGAGLLLARFAGLPKEGLRCARAASVLGTRFMPEIAAQVAGLDGTEIDAALESLGRSGLVEEGPGAGASFNHPLFRQALYDDLGVTMRARLHARAFTVFASRGMDAEAAEHAIAANLAGDMDAVAVLERAGRAARRSGALEVAAARLDAAVAMAAGRASTGLLLAQSEALLAAGRPDRSVAVCQDLLGRAGLPTAAGLPAAAGLPTAAAVQATWMLARALVMTGAHDQAHAAFVAAADLAAADDPGTSVKVLLNAAFFAVMTEGPGWALPVAGRARELAGSLGAGPQAMAEAEAIWGMTAIQAGDPAGIAAAESALPWLLPDQARMAGGEIGAPPTERSLVSGFAFAMVLVERLAESERAFATLRASADQAGDPEVTAMLAHGHGYALTRMGRLDAALEAVSTALSLTDLAPVVESFAGVGRAYIQLYRGDLADCDVWCRRVQETATARGERFALLFLWDVLGHRRLREGASGEACEYYARLEATVQQMGIGEPCLPPWPRHAISAYAAAGRTADAERVLDWLNAGGQRLPCRFPRIAAAAAGAQLAELRGDRDAALAGFEQALALHQQADLPVEHAETLLDFGAFLRRCGQLARARPVLAKAIEVAEAAQAGWLAGLAHAELRVAGGRRRQATAGLTAQETRVAGLAATGASNPQIARQLCVSVSTVETHLERVYAKLGVRSRHELIALAAAHGSIPSATDKPATGQRPGPAAKAKG
jgi:DNA-binding CsgD family transcriptional regulator